MQEPARLRRFAPVETFAIDPDPCASAAFDAEIIARERPPLIVPPPFHGDAFRTLGISDIVHHPSPFEAHRRTIRHLGDGLNWFRACKQSNRTYRSLTILLDHLNAGMT